MPASTFMPDITVEIAFSTPPDDPSPAWTDVSSYVEAASPITVSRGRSDELSDIQPSRLTVVLDNRDGRFTPGYTSSPYYPNVKKNRMIRVSAVWPLGGGGTTYRRFTGYIDEWPVQWPQGTGEYSSVAITASSRRARLAGGRELASIIEVEYGTDHPTAYYPLGEAPPAAGTAGQAGDVSGNQQPKLVAAGSNPGITWQGATGPGTDGISAPVFNGGKYLENTISGVDSTSVTLEMFINTTDVPGGGIQNGLAHYNRMALTMTSSGYIQATGQSDTVNPSSNPTVVNDGATHHVAYRETVSGSNITGTLFIDGTQVATATGTRNNPVTATGLFRVGRSRFLDGLTEAWQGVIAHAAVFSGASEVSSTRILAHANSGLTGFYGESTDARIDRLAAYAGVPTAMVNTETGLTTSIINQDTTGRTPIDLMDDVTFTEGGILFDAGDGTLVFHARNHRYNATSQFTLNASQDQVEASLEVKMDGQLLVNDITATGGSSITVRTVNTASVTEHGVRRDQIDLLTLNDNEVYDAANWRVQRYGEPDIRISTVTVDLINQSSSLITSLLAAELGHRITLSNLPSQAPAASLDLFVEGIAETIGAESYTITFELSPVVLSDVWQLDSASFSQLGTTTVLAY